ncbi:lysylphosphatidylglycerol synthase domain-containing protein [Lysobacter antibioticus]|uniref:lysylphosphatidylglycerol synthase domain-containing protein n=1 Tax=Lysobacter antibioticus TaxID=84531 RepID=UPI00034C5C42|nr:lysylphosphatidylglycerol synthase domain-containing protein [Lysobacter antibioticus]
MSCSEARRSRLRGFGLFLGLAALVWVVTEASGRSRELAWLLQDLAAGRFAASVACCLASQILFAAAWHVLARNGWIGARAIGDMSRWAQSLPGKYLPGKIWQGVARGALYADGDTAPRGVLLLFLREQCLSLGLCAAIAATYAPAALPPRAGEWLQVGLACGAVALTWAGIWRRWPIAISPRSSRLWSGRSRVGPSYRASALAWLLQAGAYSAMSAGFVVLAGGGDMPLAGSQAAAAMCLSGLIGVAALFVPAGIGVREAGLVWGLAPWVGTAEAAGLALMWRLAITGAEVMFSGAGFLLPLVRPLRAAGPGPGRDLRTDQNSSTPE